MCPKTTLKKLGPWAGVTKSYSNFSHVMHACDLHSHGFSLVTPVRQEYLWNKVCPRHPSASRKHLSYVPLKVQEGVTFLPIEPMFQGGITPKSFACSLAQVY